MESRMKRVIVFVLVGLTLQAYAKGVLDPLISFYQDKGGVVADFIQKVEVKTPHRVMKRRGRAYFKPGGLMRWDYQWPSKVYYLSDGRYFWMYDVEEGSIYRMGLNKSPLYAVLGILFEASKVYDSFKVKAENEEKKGIVKVLLVPKSEAPLKKAYITFNKDTGTILSVEIIDNVDTKSTISFRNQKFKDLPKEVFTLRIPKGIKVQDLDKTTK